MDLSKEVEYRLAKWIFANIYHEGKIDEKTYHQLLNRLLDECNPLTLMTSLAQEESRSISENVTWGQRKRFADGKVSVPYGRFLGYDRGEDGNLVVNEAEAVIIRRIYSLFLEGLTPYAIAKKLTAEHIPKPGGKTIWRGSTVRSILQNEKYKGDALLQKNFTTDFLGQKCFLEIKCMQISESIRPWRSLSQTILHICLEQRKVAMLLQRIRIL